MSTNTTQPHAPLPTLRWLDHGRIPSLDGLRALAILLVLYAHIAFPGDSLPALRAVKGRCGFLGVQIFFVLSGFLITTLMLREMGRTGRISLRQFYWRRILRIMPAYLTYVGLLALLQTGGWTHLPGRAWLALATYTVNFLPPSLPWQIAHVWSLSVEEHFYLLWPLLVAVLSLTRCRKAIFLCLAAALGLRWLLLLTCPPGRCPVDLWTFTRIDDIAMGCLLAFLVREPRWRGRLDWCLERRGRVALILAGFLTTQLCFSHQIGKHLFAPVPLQLLIGLANNVNTLTLALLLWAAVSRGDAGGGKVLNHPLAVGLGVISYSLYLWHPLFAQHAPALLSAFPQNLLFIFVTALLSYGLIEKPFLSWKARLAPETTAPRMPSPKPSWRFPVSRRPFSIYHQEESPSLQEP